MKYCDRCGAVLQDKTEYCDECGAKQTFAPKHKKNKSLFFILVIVLILGGIYFYLQNQTSTKKAKDWQDNSQKVETFIKHKLTGYKDISIKDAMYNSFDITEWKYCKEKNKEYYMCRYTHNQSKEYIIFSQTKSKIKIEEYDIKNKKQTQTKIKEFTQKYFVKEKKQDKEETKSFQSQYMPKTATYCNSWDGGLVNTCEIHVVAIDGQSFKFSIWRIVDSRGEGCNEQIFKEHIATFEEETSSIAYYRGKDYNLQFNCVEEGTIYLEGFSDATVVSNYFSNNDLYN